MFFFAGNLKIKAAWVFILLRGRLRKRQPRWFCMTLLNLLNRLTGDKKQYEKLFEEMKEHCFIGADNAPGMVLKARINMALHGAPKCSIFQTRNSLMNTRLEPGTFDAILTNPPFSKTGISKTIKKRNTTVNNDEGAEIIK